MPKMSMLEMTQDVLTVLGSDEVNSIADTVEAMTVATLIKDAYYHIITDRVIPEVNDLIQVEGLADLNKPNYLKMPANVERITMFKYNVTEDNTTYDYREIKYLSPEDFLNLIASSSAPTTSRIAVEDFSGVTLMIQNDKRPEYWTSFDDDHIVTDSYDADADSTLQKSKTLTMGKIEPIFDEFNDDFIPDLDANLFPYLVGEAKSMASVVLRQTANAKQEQRNRQQKYRMQQRKHKFSEAEYSFGNGVNYGRK